MTEEAKPHPVFDAQLDIEWDVAHSSPRETPIPTFIDSITTGSNKFQGDHADWIETIKYGEGPKQLMSIVKKPGVADDAPIMFFVHGGYWTLSGREMYIHLAEPAAKRGWIGVIIGYDQAPEVRVTTIVKQIRDAYIFLSGLFPSCPHVTISGHSAGGHLTGMLMATNWENFSPAHQTKVLPIKTYVPISGVFDVRPLIHVGYNKDIGFTREEIPTVSPLLLIEDAVFNIKKFGTKVIACVGEYDPPIFKAQCRDYIQALEKRGVDAKFIEYPGWDHFDVMEKLADPNYDLLKYIYESR